MLCTLWETQSNFSLDLYKQCTFLTPFASLQYLKNEIQTQVTTENCGALSLQRPIVIDEIEGRCVHVDEYASAVSAPFSFSPEIQTEI